MTPDGRDPAGDALETEGDARPTGEEPPPLFGSWRNLYLIVLLELALVIVLATWFTRAFD